MAASFVSYNNSSTAQSGATVVIPAPAGIADGDILLALIANDDPATFGTITGPGWTYVDNIRDASYFNVGLLWKRAASESGSYTFTTGDANFVSCTGAIAAYRGFKTSGSPINAYSNTEYSTSDTILRAAGITTTAATWLIQFGWSYGRTFTPPTNFTERMDVTTTEGISYDLNDMSQPSTGPTGNVDATISGSAYYWKSAFLIGLAVDVSTPPTVTGVSPTSGPAGTTVTLTGTGFTGATAVHFGSTNQPTFTVNSDTSITVNAP